MALVPVDEETRVKIRAELGLDKERLRHAVQCVQNWLNLQPHLPHNYGEARIERLLMRVKGSVERAKETIDLYYTLRGAVPEILSNRDPTAPWFIQASSVRCFMGFPRLGDNFERVSIISCLDPDPERYHVYDILRMVFMVAELRTVEDYCVNDVYIADLEHLTIQHMTKYTPPILKKFVVIGMKGYKARIKAIHFINCPPFVDATISLFKGLLSSKVASRIQVHRKGKETLKDFISPKVLPLDYGGEAESISVLWGQWKKKLESYREWFLEQDKYKADESKRPEKALNSNDLFGFEGSFRQLSLD